MLISYSSIDFIDQLRARLADSRRSREFESPDLFLLVDLETLCDFLHFDEFGASDDNKAVTISNDSSTKSQTSNDEKSDDDARPAGNFVRGTHKLFEEQSELKKRNRKQEKLFATWRSASASQVKKVSVLTNADNTQLDASGTFWRRA